MGSTFTGLSGKTKEDFGHGDAQFITYMNVFSNPVANLEMTEAVEIDAKQNRVKKGDVFFTTSSETPEEVGMSCVMPENKDNIYLNSFCFGYRPTEKFDLDYLAYVLRADSFRKEMKFLAQGISRYNISKNKVMEVSIPIPNLEEQTMVGRYFSTLDHLITLHQRKCEQTKKLKKYMLQKMFPRNGAKVPEIRFDGFTYDWEQRKLNEVAEKICVGFVGTCEKFYTDESGIPMYRTGNLNGLSLNRDDLKYVTNEFHQHNQKSQLKAGDILIARHGDSGKAVNYENSEEANCLNIVIIRPDFKKCNYKFLTNCINSPECQKHIKSLSAGSTQAVINTSEIEKLGVVIPANIDEQNRIARYFSTLDNLITLHQRKCDELKKMKKYMLQNMFI